MAADGTMDDHRPAIEEQFRFAGHGLDDDDLALDEIDTTPAV